MTNWEKITASREAMARLLYSIWPGKAPWAESDCRQAGEDCPFFEEGCPCGRRDNCLGRMIGWMNEGQKEEYIDVVLKRPGEPPEIRETYNTMQGFRLLLGGNPDRVGSIGDDVIMGIWDTGEEEKPENFVLQPLTQVVRGPVLVATRDPQTGDYISIENEEFWLRNLSFDESLPPVEKEVWVW